MPVSVPTMSSRPSILPAYSMIPEVLPTKSASARTSSRHSGWAANFAPGCRARTARTSSGVRSWWTGQAPPQGMISLSVNFAV